MNKKLYCKPIDITWLTCKSGDILLKKKRQQNISGNDKKY